MKVFVQVTDQEIPDVLPTEIFSPESSHGGEVVFRGLVRNVNHGRQVSALSYDSFVPLAEATLREIAAEAGSRWGEELCFAVIHRTGRLEIGEAAVVVAVSSKHRQEAFAACEYMIAELKMRAPIWKKEHYFDGESEWLQGHALCGHDRAHGHVHGHSHDHTHAPSTGQTRAGESYA